MEFGVGAHGGSTDTSQILVQAWTANTVGVSFLPHVLPMSAWVSSWSFRVPPTWATQDSLEVNSLDGLSLGTEQVPFEVKNDKIESKMQKSYRRDLRRKLVIMLGVIWDGPCFGYRVPLGCLRMRLYFGNFRTFGGLRSQGGGKKKTHLPQKGRLPGT